MPELAHEHTLTTFRSVTKESPVIKAAYACLKEAEHRSTFLVPYWNVPVLGEYLIPELNPDRSLFPIGMCLCWVST
jgi:hypothetical protein